MILVKPMLIKSKACSFAVGHIDHFMLSFIENIFQMKSLDEIYAAEKKLLKVLTQK